MKSIVETVMTSFEIRKSSFITYLHPVRDEDGVEKQLAAVKKAHPDAAHHCYAYRIGAQAEVQRFEDDGEPLGTAGRPILEVLRKNDMTHILCVVVRYFGGIKLGAGGLVRAYKKGASTALQSARISEQRAHTRYTLKLSHELAPKLEEFLQHRGTIQQRSYESDGVFIGLSIPSEEEERFVAKLKEQSQGKASVEKKKRRLYYTPIK